MKINAGLLELSDKTVASIVTTGNRIQFPAWVSEDKFSALYKADINKPTLTPEKAFYVALLTSKKASAKRTAVLN